MRVLHRERAVGRLQQFDVVAPAPPTAPRRRSRRRRSPRCRRCARGGSRRARAPDSTCAPPPGTVRRRARRTHAGAAQRDAEIQAALGGLAQGVHDGADEGRLQPRRADLPTLVHDLRAVLGDEGRSVGGPRNVSNSVAYCWPLAGTKAMPRPRITSSSGHSRWRTRPAASSSVPSMSAATSRSSGCAVVRPLSYSSPMAASRASSSARIAESMTGPSAPFITWSRLYAL